MQVVKEQVMRALTTKPSSLDQFKSKLQNLSYTEILKIRQSERMNQEDFQSRPILVLSTFTKSQSPALRRLRRESSGRSASRFLAGQTAGGRYQSRGDGKGLPSYERERCP
uniref:Engulfment and cell motility 1 n=1 Tax=Macaca mulatta TaxID=9544 RepID=A0A5F7Z8H3_MACMU